MCSGFKICMRPMTPSPGDMTPDEVTCCANERSPPQHDLSGHYAFHNHRPGAKFAEDLEPSEQIPYRGDCS